jgi:hypothetical protein
MISHTKEANTVETGHSARYPAEVEVMGACVGGAAVGVPASVGGGAEVGEAEQVSRGNCSIAEGPVLKIVNGKSMGKKQNLRGDQWSNETCEK